MDIMTKTKDLKHENLMQYYAAIVDGKGKYVDCKANSVQRLIKVAYTSGPIFEKNMKRYPIFSMQIINYQIDQKYK